MFLKASVCAFCIFFFIQSLVERIYLAEDFRRVVCVLIMTMRLDIVLIVALFRSKLRKNSVFFSPSAIHFVLDQICAPFARAISLISIFCLSCRTCCCRSSFCGFLVRFFSAFAILFNKFCVLLQILIYYGSSTCMQIWRSICFFRVFIYVLVNYFYEVLI